MLIFKRQIEDKITERLFQGKAVLIFGPRQAGKTTLSKRILERCAPRGEYFNCELASVRGHFELGKPHLLKELVGPHMVAVFDEAQTIQNIGAMLKAFIDTYPDIQIIATGSSSFDLANKINEPLTGRAFEFILYPLSLDEIRDAFPAFSRSDLEELLRTGSYPAIVAEPHAAVKEDLLKNLATNYLYKDIFTFESIRNPVTFESLIKMLAFQVGSLVSVNELALSLRVSRATIEKYLRLLEQAYVIRVVRPFSRNARNEIKKAFKVYFIDVGVRNAVIDRVAPLSGREDRGFVFENFFIMERFKDGSAKSFPPRIHFWRSRKGEEVDVIEESGETLAAYECKWNTPSAPAFPASFLKKYPDAQTRIITPDSLL